MAKVNLLDFTLPQLTQWLAARGEKPFRARQLFQWIHQRGVCDFGAMTDLARSLREILAKGAGRHREAPGDSAMSAARQR